MVYKVDQGLQSNYNDTIDLQYVHVDGFPFSVGFGNFYTLLLPISML